MNSRSSTPAPRFIARWVTTGLGPRWRAGAITLALTLATACESPDRYFSVDAGQPVPIPCEPLAAPAETLQLDLLFAIDNSNSMRENQANVMAQFGPMIRALTNPPCVSAANPSPHECDPAVPGDRPEYPAARDIHVAVVSSDLGTPGSSIPGCANSDSGDDGWLNPIRNGQALQRHLPWLTAPAGFRPEDCVDPNQFPAFLEYVSGSTDSAVFEHDFRCNAGLYVNGCGLEQQLESVWRALVWHSGPRAQLNAGFLRDDAVLGIVMLSDEEDGSVRDCRYAWQAPCSEAIDVFNASSSRWASSSVNLRVYMAQPGSARDPTWDLARYADPANRCGGFLELKPGHPERVVFAAIVGVPLAVPMIGTGSEARVNWDALLGTPDPSNRDDFTRRNAGLDGVSVDEMTSEGPISMRQANADPSCAERTVPACRRGGTPYDPARPPCTTTQQYYAWPSRRIVEVARRFDESRWCDGMPCHNGFVTSICQSDYTAATRFISETCLRRMAGR